MFHVFDCKKFFELKPSDRISFVPRQCCKMDSSTCLG